MSQCELSASSIDFGEEWWLWSDSNATDIQLSLISARLQGLDYVSLN
jgi:hypothetical protein